MYHVILVAVTATMLLGIWNLVHYSPRSIALLLPAQLAFAVGGFLLVFGTFFAFAAAVMVQNGNAMLAFILEAHVGLYFLLVCHRDDEETVRRSFLMMGALLLTLIAIFYLQDAYASALLMICLLATGYFVFSGGARFLDRGR